MNMFDTVMLAINGIQILVTLYVANQNSAIKINMQKLQIWIMQNFEPRKRPEISGGISMPN